MDSVAQRIASLRKLEGWLKAAGVISIPIGLVCLVKTYTVYAILARNDLGRHDLHQLLHEASRLMMVDFACTGLIAACLAARAICFYQLKQLKKAADA